jgi:hypothetical protein
MSGCGTFRTSRDSRPESVIQAKAESSLPRISHRGRLPKGASPSTLQSIHQAKLLLDCPNPSCADGMFGLLPRVDQHSPSNIRRRHDRNRYGLRAVVELPEPFVKKPDQVSARNCLFGHVLLVKGWTISQNFDLADQAAHRPANSIKQPSGASRLLRSSLPDLLSAAHNDSSVAIYHQLRVFEACEHGLLATWETTGELVCVPTSARAIS